MGIPLSSTGEIADFAQADQFQPARSQFECGYFAVAVCKAMAQVGKPPTQSVQQIIAEAEAWYAQYDGSAAISNTAGMSLPQLYDLLHRVGLHYQATATDIAVVTRWVALGYPVIIAITEASVHDLALGDASPYPWRAAGSHVIVVTGVDQNGNVLVRDTANCTNLYDPNSLRHGPRTYDAARLQIVSATVCVPPWLPRPASATPPTGEPPFPPTLAFSADDLQVWALIKPGIPTETDIAKEWLRARWKYGMNFGPPLEAEHDALRGGEPYAEQEFARARASRNQRTGRCTWYDGHGSFTVPL